MRKRILKLYENALNSFFGLLLYVFIGIMVFALGGFLLRAPHIFKFMGITVILGALYYFLYYPIFKSKK